MKTPSISPRRWRLTADTVPYVLLAPFVILFLVQTSGTNFNTTAVDTGSSNYATGFTIGSPVTLR
jgi:hypothetical protein